MIKLLQEPESRSRLAGTFVLHHSVCTSYVICTYYVCMYFVYTVLTICTLLSSPICGSLYFIINGCPACNGCKIQRPDRAAKVTSGDSPLEHVCCRLGPHVEASRTFPEL